ncbi:MAG: caspase family protein [Sedimentisphaerales bacterium]|nr:caspase family protein [Sedimentisphaerales bacterium]
MSKRALIVGIDEYDELNNLAGCVADAETIKEVLSRHENGDINFDCQLLVKPGLCQRITKVVLRERWVDLFDFDGDILFYFSGHGAYSETGGFFVTQDGSRGDPGLAMNDLLTLANKSKAKSILFILDCCFSGELGNPPNLQTPYALEQAQLRRGVTILAASRPTEPSVEVGGHGVFTDLVLGAMRGGASDVRGRISAASIYAYVEAALGPWDQRPLYKTHASSLPPVRLCSPCVQDTILRKIPEIFITIDSKIVLDRSYEETERGAIKENVELFKIFKRLRDARLLCIECGDDLYWAALKEKSVQLTPLGQFYWRLAKEGRI